MPRVYTKTAKPSKRSRVCTGCRESIEPGQQFYSWTRRFGRGGMEYFRHVACGRPRPTELSSRKTAQVEEAITDAQNAIGGWEPEWPAPELVDGEGPLIEVDIDDLTSAMSDVADVAESVSEEYEESRGNLPENFQNGQAGEAMGQVADELRDWAEQLRDWQPDSATFEGPDQAEGQSDAEWVQAIHDAWKEFINEVRDAASDAFDDMPEYQG